MPGYVTQRFPKKGGLIQEGQLLTDLLLREFRTLHRLLGQFVFPSLQMLKTLGLNCGRVISS